MLTQSDRATAVTASLIASAGPVTPLGTVTFLFTDIEGSTRLTEAHPQAMREAQLRHDTLLRQAVVTHGGYIFRPVGDGFCTAFDTAPEALSAAVAAQSALVAEVWEETGPLRVRMALHTGAAEERSGDYFGLTLNRVARILSAAHGGQILLSSSTYELVRDLLPEGVLVRDLGEHRLRDLLRPQPLYQAEITGLPAQFPPLRTLDNRPNNLPALGTPFIGREHEVATACAQLRHPEVRLLTLIGPGGTGKTRLALQVAAELLDDFADGVFFVPLAAIADPSLVPSAIAQALGVREREGRSPTAALREHLNGKQVLLLLDNFEHLVSAAPVVNELLAACSRLKVLVTSRSVLHLSGEHTQPVPPLTLPDRHHLPSLEHLSQYEAIALFIQHAVAAKPDFAVTNQNAPAVAEICHRLDGLPLAIELAAARVRLLSPEGILSRLALLTGGARDLPARQQTLRSTVGWSYDLLAPEQRALFRRFSVFAGGCTLEAVEAVCGDASSGDATSPINNSPDSPLETDILDGVAALVDNSLVRQEEAIPSRAGTVAEPPETRFIMLETIREYAREALAADGELGALQQRHATYYVGLAQQALAVFGRGTHRSEYITCLNGLERDHDNFRQALRWSIERDDVPSCLRLAEALHELWWKRGYYSEGRQRLQEILALSEMRARTKERANALVWASMLASLQGDGETSQAYRQESIAIYKMLGDYSLAMRQLQYLGYGFSVQGDNAAARSCFEEALTISREHDLPREIPYRYYDLANLALDDGDLDAAQAHAEESVRLSRETHSRFGEARSIRLLGEIASQRGDYVTARKLIEESLAYFRSNGNRSTDTLERLGAVAYYHSDYTAARGHWAEALIGSQDVGKRREVAKLLEQLASLHVADGNTSRALQLAGAANAIRRALGIDEHTTAGERHRWLASLPATIDQWHQAAKAALDEPTRTRTRAWAEGQALSVEQAVALALSDM